MPGGAATTAGIAVMAGTAVIVRPSSTYSSIVSATKSGGGSNASVVLIVGRPSTVMLYPKPIVQVGSSDWPLVHTPRTSTTSRAPTNPFQLTSIPATQPLAMTQLPGRCQAPV